MDLLGLLLPFLLLIVLGILIAGVVVMARGGEVSRKWSNKLMQARVLAQLFAIVVIVIIVVASAG